MFNIMVYLKGIIVAASLLHHIYTQVYYLIDLLLNYRYTYSNCLFTYYTQVDDVKICASQYFLPRTRANFKGQQKTFITFHLELQILVC